MGYAGSVSISYSDVEEGEDLVHVYSGSTLNWGTGMIDADPKFVNILSGDLHLCLNNMDYVRNFETGWYNSTIFGEKTLP